MNEDINTSEPNIIVAPEVAAGAKITFYKVKPDAIIIDIDGTIAEHEPHRGIFEFDKVHLDKRHDVIISLIQRETSSYRSMGYLGGFRPVYPLYLTGRPESCREQTHEWLVDNGLPPGELFMRNTLDSRKGHEVKLEIYNARIRDRYNILYVLEDSNTQTRMWRAQGLTCLQVKESDY